MEHSSAPLYSWFPSLKWVQQLDMPRIIFVFLIPQGTVVMSGGFHGEFLSKAHYDSWLELPIFEAFFLKRSFERMLYHVTNESPCFCQIVNFSKFLQTY